MKIEDQRIAAALRPDGDAFGGSAHTAHSVPVKNQSGLRHLFASADQAAPKAKLLRRERQLRNFFNPLTLSGRNNTIDRSVGKFSQIAKITMHAQMLAMGVASPATTECAVENREIFVRHLNNLRAKLRAEVF